MQCSSIRQPGELLSCQRAVQGDGSEPAKNKRSNLTCQSRNEAERSPFGFRRGHRLDSAQSVALGTSKQRMHARPSAPSRGSHGWSRPISTFSLSQSRLACVPLAFPGTQRRVPERTPGRTAACGRPGRRMGPAARCAMAAERRPFGAVYLPPMRNRTTLQISATRDGESHRLKSRSSWQSTQPGRNYSRGRESNWLPSRRIRARSKTQDGTISRETRVLPRTRSDVSAVG